MPELTDCGTRLTKVQLAIRWDITTRTVENMMARGEIPKPIRLSYKVVRWRLCDIIAHEKNKT